MTDNRDLLELAGEFTGNPDVEVATMFRSPGLRVGGKIFAFLGSDGDLIVKLPRDRVAELVDAGTAEQVVMGKRRMREWVTLPHSEDLTLWRDLAREAHRYVDSLRQPT